MRCVWIALKTLVPESDVPPDQQVYEDAHLGLRIWNQPVDPGLPDLLHRMSAITPEAEADSQLRKNRYSVGIRRSMMRPATLGLAWKMTRELRRRKVAIPGLSVMEVCRLSVADALKFFDFFA